MLVSGLLLLVAAGFLLSFHRSSNYLWSVFRSPDDKFSVEIAGEIQSHPNGVTTNPEDWVFYTCIFLDDPNLERVASSDNLTEKMLDSHRNAVLAKYHGLVVSEKSMSIQGFPARDIEATLRSVRYPENSHLDLRIIMVHYRMYYLMVETDGHKRDSQSTARFFDSFKLN